MGSIKELKWKKQLNMLQISFKESTQVINRKKRINHFELSWQNNNLFKFRQREIHVCALCGEQNSLILCTFAYPYIHNT